MQKKLIVKFSNERLLTPSGLSLVGSILGKSKFVKKLNHVKVGKDYSEYQIKNGDILLTFIGLLTQGKTSFESVNEMKDDPEFYRYALGVTNTIPSAETLRQRMDAIGGSLSDKILAANVDQAVLVVTVTKPETSTTFIDRFLASAEAYRVPVFLVFNKTDLLSADELRYQQMMVQLYETVGYTCFTISAIHGEGLDALRPLLDGKITLLSGNSGVGKSTLINRLVPHANLRTAEISDAHNTGMHTTTFSEMIPLSPAAGGQTAAPRSWLIDTPGIKGFGTFDMEREELTSYFKEIFEFSKQCRFSDCTHTHEPGCAVLKAVEDHYIAQSRYQSYLSMLEDKDENRYREAY